VRVKAREILIGLSVALLLALVLSPFASSSPDGLEKVAEQKGFLAKGEGEPALNAPVPDYAWPGLADEGHATRLAGVVGTLVTFAAAWGVAALLLRV
jgi:cobalt/nickel transport protein